MMTSQTATLSSSSSSSTSTTTIPQPSTLRVLPLWKRQRGSLPLKKRRFLGNEEADFPRFYTNSSSDNGMFASATTNTQLQPVPELSHSALNPLLALVAAATVSTDPSPCYEQSSLSPPLDYPTTFQQQQQQFHTFSTSSSSSTQSRHDEVQQQEEEVSEDSAKATRVRVPRPPLSQPLPGGCHGRTSRNNSYCRRHPCWKGSKYCKLHYQQHRMESGGCLEGNDATETANPPPQATPHAATCQSQDKRFSGVAGETRCRATTTRGRACAYVSVNDTKYCHLHADYDVNPPPRRGGTGGACASKQKRHNVLQQQQQQQQMDLQAPSVQQPEPVEKAVVAPPKKRSKKPKPVNNSPFSLLSSISSDQWFDKLVLISTGPLKNTKGRVVKWGNGWVTVRTTSSGGGEEGLLHNRRSVELLLLPQEEENAAVETNKAAGEEWNKSDMVEEEEETKQSSGPDDQEEGSNNDKVVLVMPEEQRLSLATDEHSSEDLHRCVSIETETPAVSTSSSSVKSDPPPFVVTGDMTPPLDKKEEQQPPPPPSVFIASKDKETEAIAPPAHQAAFASGTQQQPQLVTPNSPRRVAHPDSSVKDNAGIPLMDCLVAAQQGKFKLDMLFGTAALERSRRTVHKPTRYEDTAMLERKRARMGMADCESDSLLPSPQSPKRARLDSPRK